MCKKNYDKTFEKVNKMNRDRSIISLIENTIPSMKFSKELSEYDVIAVKMVRDGVIESIIKIWDEWENGLPI